MLPKRRTFGEHYVSTNQIPIIPPQHTSITTQLHNLTSATSGKYHVKNKYLCD